MTDREYFEYLKKEYQKAVATAKKYGTVVEFDTIESMHLAELEEYFENQKQQVRWFTLKACLLR